MLSLLLVVLVSLTTVSFSDADHPKVVTRLFEVQDSSSEEEVAVPEVTAIDLEQIQELIDLLGEEATLVPNGCTCTSASCSCCANINIKKFRAEVCVNLGYTVQPVGLIFSLTYNGKVIFKTTITVSNPPPFCIGVPVLPVAKLCIQFSNLAWKNKHFSGCASLQVNLFGKTILKVKLGCFNFGSASQWGLDFPPKGVNLPAKPSAQEITADAEIAHQFKLEVEDNSLFKLRSSCQLQAKSRVIKMLLEPLSSDM